MKKEAQIPLIQADKILLAEIVLLKSSLQSSDAYLDDPVKPEKIAMVLGSAPKFSLESKSCRFRLHVMLEGQDEAGTPLGLDAEFMADFVFVVDNFDDYAVREKNHLHVHPILGATLLGISFSTIRGIVMERTKGSPLAGFILPVINPMKTLFDSMDIEPVPALAEPRKIYKQKKKTAPKSTTT